MISLGSLRELGDARALDVAVLDGAGNQLTGFDGSRPAVATLSNVNATTTSGVMLAANPARRQVFIEQEGNGTTYVAFAATATVAAYTFKLPGNGSRELALNGYTGVISVIRGAGTATLRVTEVTTT